MHARSSVVWPTLVALLAAAALLHAQPPGVTLPRSGRAAMVFGFVWDANNNPIAFANVRLRNVTSGRLEANAVAAENGEFSFDNLEGGTYLIEYVDRHGKVLAVSHVFSASPGETVATFLRLGNRVPWFAALLGSGANAAATAIASAASVGVTALVPASRAVSPES